MASDRRYKQIEEAMRLLHPELSVLPPVQTMSSMKDLANKYQREGVNIYDLFLLWQSLQSGKEGRETVIQIMSRFPSKRLHALLNIIGEQGMDEKLLRIIGEPNAS